MISNDQKNRKFKALYLITAEFFHKTKKRKFGCNQSKFPSASFVNQARKTNLGELIKSCLIAAVKENKLI